MRNGYSVDEQQTLSRFGGRRNSLYAAVTPKPFAKLFVHLCNMFLLGLNSSYCNSEGTQIPKIYEPGFLVASIRM